MVEREGFPDCIEDELSGFKFEIQNIQSSLCIGSSLFS